MVFRLCKDLKSVRDAVVGLGHDRVFLLGHSMGGGIAVYTAMMYPEAFAGLALTAPMIAINTAPYPRSVAYSAADATFWWQGETFVLGGDYWEPTGSDEDFNSNYVTQSRTLADGRRPLPTVQRYLPSASTWQCNQSMAPRIYPRGLVDDLESPQAQLQP